MFENYSNDELLILIKKGNRYAYNTLFLRQYPTLCSYAMQYVDYESGQDIVQDVMLWLWENRKQLEIKNSIESYLFIAIKNKCLTFINRNILKSEIHDVISYQRQNILSDPNPYILKELGDNIDKAVDKLPILYREAFVLNRFRGKTYREIADLLNISSKTVDYRIQQALKMLREDLHEYLTIQKKD